MALVWFAWKAAAQETRASQAAFRSAHGSPGRVENSEVARKRERSAGLSMVILKAQTQGCELRKAPCSCDRAAAISVTQLPSRSQQMTSRLAEGSELRSGRNAPSAWC